MPTFAYIPSASSNTVSVINKDTNTVTTTISDPSFSTPLRVAVTPDDKFVYITNFNGNTISVIDTATNTVLRTIAVVSPQGIAITPNGLYAYVANNILVGTVTVIRISDDAIITTIPVGSFPNGIAITPLSDFVYVSNNGSGFGNTVSVIETTGNTVVATVPTGTSPVGIVVDNAGAFVYVTNIASDDITVITNSFPYPTITITGFSSPAWIAITPDGLTAYVSNNNNDTVQRIDTNTKTLLGAPIALLAGSNPQGIDVSPQGDVVYVANNGLSSVSVISTSTFMRVSPDITVGAFPVAIGLFFAIVPSPTPTPTPRRKRRGGAPINSFGCPLQIEARYNYNMEVKTNIPIGNCNYINPVQVRTEGGVNVYRYTIQQK